VDSLTAPGYTLAGDARYPHIIEDFHRSFETVRALPCDLLLTPHADASGWNFPKPGDPHPRPTTRRGYAGAAAAKIDAQLAHPPSR